MNKCCLWGAKLGKLCGPCKKGNETRLENGIKFLRKGNLWLLDNRAGCINLECYNEPRKEKIDQHHLHYIIINYLNRLCAECYEKRYGNVKWIK